MLREPRATSAWRIAHGAAHGHERAATPLPWLIATRGGRDAQPLAHLPDARGRHVADSGNRGVGERGIGAERGGYGVQVGTTM